MSFQQIEHFGGEHRQFIGHRLQFLPRRCARNPGDHRAKISWIAGPICWSLPCPARRHAFLNAGHDHLGDVAPADGDPFSDAFERALFGAHGFGERFKFLGARDQRRKIESEGDLNLPCPILARIAFAIGAVSPHDQSSIDQDGEVTPERRRRHAVRAQAELAVGRKDHEVFAREHGFWMKRQQRIEHRQRALGHGETRPRRANRPEHMPFMREFFRRARFRRRLACHMGKLQRPPPKGRRRYDGVPCLLPFIGQKKSARRNGAQSLTRLLTAIRGNGISQVRTMRRASGILFRGPFSFAGCSLLGC